MNTEHTRTKAVATFVSLQGPHVLPLFLETRQPAFDDMTGAEILQQRPEELLRRLQMIEEARELETICEEGGPDDD